MFTYSFNSFLIICSLNKYNLIVSHFFGEYFSNFLVYGMILDGKTFKDEMFLPDNSIKNDVKTAYQFELLNRRKKKQIRFWLNHIFFLFVCVLMFLSPPKFLSFSWNNWYIDLSSKCFEDDTITKQTNYGFDLWIGFWL